MSFEISLDDVEHIEEKALFSISEPYYELELIEYNGEIYVVVLGDENLTLIPIDLAITQDFASLHIGAFKLSIPLRLVVEDIEFEKLPVYGFKVVMKTNKYLVLQLPSQETEKIDDRYKPFLLYDEESESYYVILKKANTKYIAYTLYIFMFLWDKFYGVE